MSFLNKIINKHTINLASSAAMPVIGMLVLALMGRYLNQADFGRYVFFLQTFLMADIFRTGFLQTSLVKYYSGADADRALNIAGSAWYVGFMLSVGLALIDLVIYLFVRGSGTELELTVKWFGIIYLCTLPSAVAIWILQAQERFDKMFLLQVVNQLGFFILVLALIALHRVNYTSIVISYLINNIITSIICMAAGWSQVHSIKHKSVSAMKELVHFGKFSVGTSIGATLLRSSDVFIIGMLFPVKMLGVYFIPQRLLEIFEIPMRSFVSTALPELSAAKQRNDDKAVAEVMKRYAGLLTVLILILAVLAFLLVGVGIHILFGDKYSGTDANNIFRLFLCYVIIMPIDRFFGITLDIMNKPKLNMAKVFIMLAVNIAADFIGYYFTKSLWGIAIASLFTYYTGLIFGYVQLKKYLNFSMSDILTIGYAQLKSTVHNLLNKKVNTTEA
ncbi:oligosaccharide flippase family protein [Mucilaginibacter pallidiroseus]|uniref:Oligosaccharide flippase family protein n=1 Tax=Mucilaginibacter pallidiroseus TaxID=2599295 RepID=A0A563UIC4_9SPHI|nr:oligosaccharide flippase family protein [Mucilaginibacter pallidiroseus]TWR31039.1 oligosaccharide flippase family protein [Mucilaginibacter pallidiroseus]